MILSIEKVVPLYVALSTNELKSNVNSAVDCVPNIDAINCVL